MRIVKIRDKRLENNGLEHLNIWEAAWTEMEQWAMRLKGK